MKIVPIVIWYYPEKLGDDVAIKNILSYSNYFEKIIIVDNSHTDNSKLANEIPNAQYVPNFDNLGIAAALNQGCEFAFADGYDWIMSMDQDSSWDEENIVRYLSIVFELFKDNTQIISFSPTTKPVKRIRSVAGDIKHFFTKNATSHLFNSTENDRNDNEFEYVDRVISSGNIFNLSTWKSVNKFNESLFINDVDYDICYRCIEMGYKIVKILSCEMSHVDGEPKKTLLPRICWYHKERIYYLIRNKYYIISKYPNFAKKFNYKPTIRRIILEKLMFLQFSDLKFAIRGVLDGKNHKYGKYENSARIQ